MPRVMHELIAASLLVAFPFTAGTAGAAEPPKSGDLGEFLCKDVMRMSGEDRQIALGAMHGYLLGKKGTTKYVPDELAKASDAFTEHCLDHPGEKALASLAKFVK